MESAQRQEKQALALGAANPAVADLLCYCFWSVVDFPHRSSVTLHFWQWSHGSVVVFWALSPDRQTYVTSLAEAATCHPSPWARAITSPWARHHITLQQHGAPLEARHSTSPFHAWHMIE